jgi:hypothetical protein
MMIRQRGLEMGDDAEHRGEFGSNGEELWKSEVEKKPRCGGDWCGVSMQELGAYCMHKEHRDYKNAEQRRDCGSCWV